jgi:hypothetical protein
MRAVKVDQSRSKMSRGVLAVACLSAVLAAGFYFFSQRSLYRGPRSLGAVGKAVESYEVTLDTSAKTPIGELIRFHLRGVLRLSQTHKTAQKLEILARLDDAVLTSPQANEESAQRMRDAAKDFARPMLLEVDSEGRISVVHEDSLALEQVRLMLKSILGALQHVEPKQHGATWETNEQDTSGSYDATYAERDEANVFKQKLRYTKLANDTSLSDQDPELAVVKSEHRFQFRDDGGLESLEVVEQLGAKAEQMGKVDSTTTLSLRRMDTEQPGPLATPEEIVALQRTTLQRLALGWGLSSNVDYIRIAGRHIDEVLDETEEVLIGLEALHGTPEEQAKSRANYAAMTSLFRLNTDAVNSALERLDSEELSGPQASRVWDSMGSAGSPHAQTGLREIIEMPRWTEEERRSQMISLSMVARPTPDTLKFLRERFDDPEQNTQARYGFGTAIHNLKESDPKAAQQAFQELNEALKSATDPTKVQDLLSAVGNAGMAEGVAVAKNYVHAESPAIRAAAAEAVRFSPGPEADQMLAEMLQAEPSDVVRQSIMLSFKDRPASEGSIAILTEAARNDPSMATRQLAISALNSYASHLPELQLLVNRLIAENKPS